MTIDALETIWPEWKVEKQLGKGSYGVVYKAVRRDHNVESCAAIKLISIPSDASEVDSLRSEGLSPNATRTYLQGIVDDFVGEIQLMESLKGIQNIVSVEDYKVVERTGELGWDIYIRMELLTPFNTYICDKKLTEEEVIQLGCDICTALEICGKRNIIHRDIKPENIFINDFGYFKLGDFGIARKLENVSSGLSQKGTFNYMAPEVANSTDYDARVDIYSLGIVLYRLLNGNRLPFLDTEKQLLNPNERRNAVERRIRGEALPAPCEASPAMADLILRACAFDPDRRFSSAAEMKQALESVRSGTYQPAAADPDQTVSIHGAAASDKTTTVRKPAAASDPKVSLSFKAAGNLGAAGAEPANPPAGGACGTKTGDSTAEYTLPRPSPEPAQTPPTRSTGGTGTAARNTVWALCTSAQSLVAIITYSLAILFSLCGAINGSAGIIGQVISSSDLRYTPGAITFIAFIVMLPKILIAVGLWMIYASARQHSIKTTGLSITKVIIIIRCVFVCIGFAAGIIGAVVTAAVGGLPKKEYIVAGVIIGVITIAIVAALVILYYLKAIQTVNTIKTTIFTGNPSNKVSAYIAVFSFILAGVLALSAIAGGSVPEALSRLCAAAASVAFGVLILSYRKKMRQLLGS